MTKLLSQACSVKGFTGYFESQIHKSVEPVMWSLWPMSFYNILAIHFPLAIAFFFVILLTLPRKQLVPCFTVYVEENQSSH